MASSILSTIADFQQPIWNALSLLTRPSEVLSVISPSNTTDAKSKAAFNPETDIQDQYLAGKVVLITGGNAGLGKETVLQLARHKPAKIFLAARNEGKAKAAIDDIYKQLQVQDQGQNQGIIEWIPLDLSSLASVKAAAETVLTKTDRLDILILNAGVMALPLDKTTEGFEIQLGTNHVGHFLLTKLLLPVLQRTASSPPPPPPPSSSSSSKTETGTKAEEQAAAAAAAAGDVRVISVASIAHNFGPSSVEGVINSDKQTSPWVRYGASKIANILFAAELARRLNSSKQTGVTAVSLHPGVIITDLYKPSQESASPFSLTGLMNLVMPMAAVDVHQGALNQLYLATATPKSCLVDGGFYLPVGRWQPTNKWATNAEAGRRLWDWTEAELKKVGY